LRPHREEFDMKIALSEIWNFSKIIDTDERGWSYHLNAGNVNIQGIAQEVILDLKSDDDFDTELLPSIFTFREILWQPDLYTEASQSLPGLRILKAHCQEIVEVYHEEGKGTSVIYAQLLNGIITACDQAIEALQNERNSVKKVLGDLRTVAFPLIKFFIYHPRNRKDYHIDALNRLNYSVKIMLTQFHGKYTELTEPFWEVSYEKPTVTEATSPPATETNKD